MTLFTDLISPQLNSALWIWNHLGARAPCVPSSIPSLRLHEPLQDCNGGKQGCVLPNYQTVKAILRLPSQCYRAQWILYGFCNLSRHRYRSLTHTAGLFFRGTACSSTRLQGRLACCLPSSESCRTCRGVGSGRLSPHGMKRTNKCV